MGKWIYSNKLWKYWGHKSLKLSYKLKSVAKLDLEK